MSSDPEKELYNLIETHLPKEIALDMKAFCQSYKEAIESTTVFNSLIPMLSAYIDRIKDNLHQPYLFPHYHEQERRPFDFYSMARSIISPLIDHEKSLLQGKEVLQEIEQTLQRKENVIFLANHQSEIDPQIISLMVEPYSPTIAEKTVYIAGHRVTTDPLAVPFSRGCNLICIYSKKHIEHTPEKRTEWLQHNARSMAKIDELLNLGGVALYVAPSGGRDRWDESGQVQIAPFDPQSVEMFRLFSKKTPIPTHFHLLTLDTIKLLPPPKERQKELGEARLPSKAPVHLSFSPEISFEETNIWADKKQLRQERAEEYTNQIKETYQSFFLR
jgi:glycerol-3-phosphate O-acyltransferase